MGSVRNIKLTIQYDGTYYCGWQSQKNGVAVQDVIKDVLEKILGEKIKLIGSGRTDSGVHAKGQVANFKTNSRLPLDNIRKALNKNLTKDIIITKINQVSDDFHAQYKAKSKIYRYTFSNKDTISPFCKNYTTKIPYKLDLDLMKKEARDLVGRHDFSAFQGAGSKRESAIRTLKKIVITPNGKAMYIDIESEIVER